MDRPSLRRKLKTLPLIDNSMRPALQLTPERLDELRAFLTERGFSFETRPHQVFLARKGMAVVNLYTNGKIVTGGSDSKLIEEVRHSSSH